MFQCPFCFDYFRGLILHIKKKHPNKQVTQEYAKQTLYQCEGCEKILSSSTSLKRHQKTCKTKSKIKDIEDKLTIMTEQVHKMIQDEKEKENNNLKEQLREKNERLKDKDEIIKDKDERIQDKNDFAKFIQKMQLGNVNSNNKYTTINITVDSLPPITNKWLQQLFSHVVDDAQNITTIEDIIDIMEKHGLAERIHMNDQARMKISWKDGDDDNKVIKDIRGVQLCNKTKNACKDQIYDLRQYIGNNMTSLEFMSPEYERCRRIVDCLDSFQRSKDDVGALIVQATSTKGKYSNNHIRDLEEKEESKLTTIKGLIKDLVDKQWIMFILSNQNNMSYNINEVLSGYIERDPIEYSNFIILDDNKNVVRMSSKRLNTFICNIVYEELPPRHDVMKQLFVLSYNKELNMSMYLRPDDNIDEVIERNCFCFYDMNYDDINLTIMLDGRIKK